MDNGIRVGHFLGDGGDVHIPIGFIPDYFRLCDLDGVTSNVDVTIHEWFERMEDDEATARRAGWGMGFATLGYLNLHGDGAGITAYDTGSVSPASGTGAGQLAQWVASTSYTARTATARGSFVKGTVSATNNLGQVVDREAIFECVTGGTSGTTEPSWPSAVGGQVLDSTPVWELVVDVPVKQQGYQGVTVAAEIAVSDHECYYLAIRAHDSVDHGDVDGWPSGVDPDWS